MSSEALKEVAGKVGDQFFALAKAKLMQAKEQLSAQGLEALEAAARDRAELTVMALSGEDVSSETAIVDATIANWTWVGAHKAQTALIEAAEEAAEMVGKLLGSALKGIL